MNNVVLAYLTIKLIIEGFIDYISEKNSFKDVADATYVLKDLSEDRPIDLDKIIDIETREKTKQLINILDNIKRENKQIIITILKASIIMQSFNKRRFNDLWNKKYNRFLELEAGKKINNLGINI
ncbi:hypothetical protein [Gluconobacter cerinus]|uniref:hypothetical protein n=1 Tax=Gluconobacter cerinus TaxID=38307 RepID=UPI001B8D7EAD|nr:hypothetical protein [Gluconobacter cerinus]MBS0984518.1 hypothetical protein [Gluconobacter cerinus]